MKQVILLLLMFAQLLIGSGIPVFACISKDGSYSVVAGSSLCSVCQSHDDDDDHSCDEGGSEDPDCTFFDNKGNSSWDYEIALNTESCGCKHVPGMLVSDLSTRAARHVFSIELEQLFFIMLPWSTIRILPSLPLQTSLSKDFTSVTYDLLTYVLSTIVIRC